MPYIRSFERPGPKRGEPKTKVQFSLSTELVDRFREYLEDTGISYSKFAEIAIKEGMEREFIREDLKIDDFKKKKGRE